MEVDDLDFMELLPVLGDELGDDDENFTLSQIADRIELDYIKSECMISNFADMTFDLGYQFESGETGPSHSNMEVTTIQDTCTLSENSLRFGNPVKDEDLDELISGTTPANTKKSTAWAVRVFNDWRISRNTALENIPNLDHFSADDINRWLSRFIVEVRKRDGDFYPPKSLYLLTTGILRYMRENGNTLNFMNEKDDRFIRFRRSLDAQMKFLTSKGYGSTVRQADPISRDQEERLWTSGVIGHESSEALLYGVFFYNCKLFGLRGRDEHHDLDISQFEVGEDDTGKFIQFVGRANKTFKGGLKHRNVDHKNIKHYVTTEDSDRNLVHLYTSYIGLIGDKDGKFYKRPIPGTLKFSKQNIGVNRLENLMKEMCNKAGLEGNFTNQSGKRTCATQLYQSGLDEQQIMSRTGHRSLNGVRKYKRASNDQLRDLSNILEPPCSKKVKIVEESSLCVQNATCSSGKENHNVDVKPSLPSLPKPGVDLKCNVGRTETSATEILNQLKSGFNQCSFTFNFGN